MTRLHPVHRVAAYGTLVILHAVGHMPDRYMCTGSGVDGRPRPPTGIRTAVALKMPTAACKPR